MLYYLFRYLSEFGIPGSHMWSYISFRALLTLVLSLIISAWFGEWFIKWMKSKNLSEEQRDASIDPYGVTKQGGGFVWKYKMIPIVNHISEDKQYSIYELEDYKNVIGKNIISKDECENIFGIFSKC